MKVLFIGLGGIGQRHLRRLLEVRQNVQIAAVRARGHRFEITDELVVDHNADIEEKYGLTVFKDLGEAIEAWRPHIAVVANPTILHVPTALQLVRAGTPVLLEKPVSNDLEGALNLYKEVRRLGGRVSVGYMMRYHPGVRRLRELITGRSFGPVMSANITISSYMPVWHNYEPYNAFYAGRSDLGGGAILTETHEIDLLCWLFGRADKVWACGGTLSGLDLDVEDTIGAALRFTVDGQSLPVTLSLSFARQPLDRRIVIHSQQGRLCLDLVRSELISEVGDEKWIESYSHISRNDLFRSQIEAFVQAVEESGPMPTPLEEVIDGHLTALAIKDALVQDALVTPNKGEV